MEFQRVHQQLLQSHHLFEPLSPVQLQELLASSDLVNLDGRLRSARASRRTPSTT